MNLLTFFIKSNSLLRRTQDLESIVIAHTELLRKVADCPVSIVLRKNRKAYGQPCSVEILKNSGPVLSLFSWNDHPAFFITDGIVMLWSRICSPVPLSTAISQTDIILHTLVLQEELQKVAITDGLTGLYNRKYFMDRFAEEISIGNSSGFILMDLDLFKTYNDSFGHPEGDILLQKVGDILRINLRGTDIAGRCGGEEFGVLIPECEDLLTIAEKIRGNIEKELCPPEVKRQVTCSVGGSIFPVDGTTVDDLYQVADQRLYLAKSTGRNRVVVNDD